MTVPMPDFAQPAGALSPLKRAFIALEGAQSRLAALQAGAREPIAIIGMGCRVPGGADTPDAFWRLLSDGVDAIGVVPSDRWDIDALYDPNPDAPGKIVTRYGGFVRGIDRFDPVFFGIAPREAAGMDPQQRLLLEVAWEALEHAAQSPDRLERSMTGVYVGVTGSDYTYLQLKSQDTTLLDPHFASGIAHSVVSGRVSYLLGLQGASLTIDTACSSSLVAVHLACQALRAGECQMALAGGVNAILSPDLYIAFTRSRMLAPDGRCKTFDAAADGFARAEGCGVIVLKRLSDARAAGDRILAVIRGSAVNQDGPSSGLTAPNGPAQEAVIHEALTRAGLKPSDVGYIEAHGTGTQLGDPLEVHALAAVFGDRDPKQPLVLGSVKTNVGHLESAAGIAGLIKTVLALQHCTIPAHLHFKTPSPHIQWADHPLRVPTHAEAWQPINGKRIAGVSAFGFSGTNAHVVLEEAPAPAETLSPPPDRPAYPLVISARDEQALASVASRYAAALEMRPESDVAAVCHTANVGRARFAHRAAIVASTMSDLRVALKAVADGRTVHGVRTAVVARRDPPRIAFLFTGQGAQYAGMTKGLYAHAPVFRSTLDRCAELLQSHLKRPLLDVMFAGDGSADALNETQYTQPALFAVEYALAELWRACGVVPNLVLGHSVGEYVAACLAGVMSLEDALRLIARRGVLMQSLPAGGGMAAIFAPEAQVIDAIAAHAKQLSIAAVNGPAQTVIAGPATLVDAVSQNLTAHGVRCQRLTVSHAFHSPLVEPILDAFEREVASVRLSAPRLTLISNVSGAVAKADEIVQPRYWRRHLREAVRFGDGLLSLNAHRPDCIVEIGPHPTLLSFATAVLGEGGPERIPSLHKQRGDWEQLLEGMSRLCLAGVDVDWRALEHEGERRIVDLPTYPFERQRCWFQAKPTRAASSARRPTGHPLLGAKVRTATADAIYESQVSADEPSFVRQHRVLDHVIVPATAFLDTLHAAARATLGRDAVQINDVVVQEAMVLEDDGTPRVMQVVCERPSGGATVATIHSTSADSGDNEPWVTHVRASLRVADAARVPDGSLDGARASCTTAMSPVDFYAGFERRGLDFGSGFRSIRALWRGAGQALGHVELATDLAPESSAYGIHPVLLDGCVQLIAAAVPDDGDVLYLPIGIESYTLYAKPGLSCWSHVVVSSATNGESLRGDIRLFDANGAGMGQLVVILKRVSGDALAQLGDRRLDRCLYDVQWHAVAAGAATQTTWPLQDLVRAGGDSVPSLTTAAGIDAYDAFLLRFDALCAAYVSQAMRRLGWTAVEGELVTTSALAERLRVAPKYLRLFGRLLGILAEAGVIARESAGWRAVKPLPTDTPEHALTQLRAQCPPGADAELEMTARVAGDLAEALRGERDPMQLLFPGGSIANAESLYRDSPTAKFYNGLIAEVVSAIAAMRPKGRSLRILEVGAGTGGTTAHVAPRLPADGVDYTFTDVGSTFVARARTRFAVYPFMRFETLDLEREPEVQEIGGRRFDVVIASNVIHATSDLRRTLGRVRRLLAPGGLLVMLEVTAPQRWFDLTVGVTDGWWAFTDADLRVDYPTLSRERWLQLLGECGFDAAVALPAGSGHTGCLALQSLLVAAASEVTAAAGREWLVFADRRGVVSALADRLRAGGDRCTVVHAGPSYSVMSGAYTIDPADPADYRRLLGEFSAAGRAIDGVVHGWSLDADEWEHMSLERLKTAECGGAVSAMYLAQALVKARPEPRLWILTSGAHQIDAEDRVLSPAQAGAWGVGKALTIEHPQLRCVCVDLEPGAEIAGLDIVVSELGEPGGETHIAVRRGSRHVARLTRLARAKAVEPRERSAVRLVPETGGSLERFRLEPMNRPAPGPGEVEIAVAATGLNFKDVLNALGMYPGDPGPLGGECAGQIVGVGPGVSHLSVGDEVLAVAGGSFASHVVAKAAFVQPRPQGMSAEEGAGVPIAYLTAEFCLGHLASMRAGERVLIHAAAGGVGMAAVRLAQRAGAEVFATAGSPRKRDLLRSMGVAHVMDSRTTAFADAILAETGGTGVDIVLNSLSGDQIEASFRALARYGRFVEIGKRGIKDEEWVAAQGGNHRYFIVDWGETAALDPDLIGGMLERLVGELRDGSLPALPRHVFALDEVSRAFRFMAQARHTGKIVVRHGPAAAPTIRRDGTYLITGGLSGLGLAVAQWLAERGAGRLVLVGRRGVTAEASPVIDVLRGRGTTVVAESLDVSDETAVSDLLTRIRRNGPPLRGVVHSAGALDDAGLIRQDAARFARVFAPKTHGAYLLDSLTRADPLDMFVLFSSAASVLGSGGQSNHSAANAVLDTLARERQARGLPGLSINWGPWKDIGAAADRGITDRLASEGLEALSARDGLVAFERALNGVNPQVAVLSIDWHRFQQRARHVSSPFFADVAGATTTTTAASAARATREEDLRQRVADAPDTRRSAIVQAFIAEKVLRALGLDPARAVDPRTPLGELGLDSLLAVELRNTLGTALGKSLPATLLFDYPTIATLADYLMTEVLELKPAAVEVRAAAAVNLVVSIEDLSDEEVERMLAARARRPDRT